MLEPREFLCIPTFQQPDKPCQANLASTNTDTTLTDQMAILLRSWAVPAPCYLQRLDSCMIKDEDADWLPAGQYNRGQGKADLALILISCPRARSPMSPRKPIVEVSGRINGSQRRP